MENPPELIDRAPDINRKGWLYATRLWCIALSLLLSACDISVPYPLTDVHVHAFADGSCGIEQAVVPCAEVGARLGERFKRRECHVLLDVDRRATFDHVGEALRSIQNRGCVAVEFAPAAFSTRQ